MLDVLNMLAEDNRGLETPESSTGILSGRWLSRRIAEAPTVAGARSINLVHNNPTRIAYYNKIKQHSFLTELAEGGQEKAVTDGSESIPGVMIVDTVLIDKVTLNAINEDRDALVITKMNIRQLNAELRARNYSTYGNRKELVKRLQVRKLTPFLVAATDARRRLSKRLDLYCSAESKEGDDGRLSGFTGKSDSQQRDDGAGGPEGPM
jgi:ribosomal protein L33